MTSPSLTQLVFSPTMTTYPTTSSHTIAQTLTCVLEPYFFFQINFIKAPKPPSTIEDDHNIIFGQMIGVLI